MSNALNTASSNFTVAPNGVYNGTITITPSGGGLSTPTVLTFSNSSASQAFTVTPTAVGPVTLTPSNSGSLTNPAALTYATPPGAPTNMDNKPAEKPEPKVIFRAFITLRNGKRLYAYQVGLKAFPIKVKSDDGKK